MKTCITCRIYKNLDVFTLDKSKSDDYYSICKSCLKEKREMKKQEKKKTSPRIVNALCNLQPLWATENLSKFNKF